MDSYDSELEKAKKAFQLLPRKLSEENVRMLGNLNHFETFEEDNIEVSPGVKGKRISLSGSIVVLDLDFVAAKPDAAAPGSQSAGSGSASTSTVSPVVANASMSLSNDTPANAPFAAMSAVNHPDEHVLASLREPRLDSFGKILAGLSKCDRFSTKDIDCFKALGLVAEAVFLRQKLRPEAAPPSGEFGRLVVNPAHSLGLAFDFAPTLRAAMPRGSGPAGAIPAGSGRPEMSTSERFAFLTIAPGSRPQYCLRPFTEVSDWIDPTTGAWVAEPGTAPVEARAELCLALDPPLLISDVLAEQLDAELAATGPVDPDLDARWQWSSFGVARHPRFASASNRSDDFDIMVGNMLPFRLVRVAQIPLRSPGEIADVLAVLRQFAVAAALMRSVLHGGDPAPANEAAELNIADALELPNQPVHSKRIPLSVSWRSVNDALEIDVVWVVSDLQMTIMLPRSGDIQVRVTPSTVKLNMADINKLVRAGRLDLALSYAVTSSGRLHRRSTASSV